MEQQKFDSHLYLEAGADAAMKIFDRVDEMKTKPAPFLHTAVLTSDRDVEYFLKKLEELEGQYRKTLVLAFDPEGKIIANVPTVNLEDTTDLSQGFSTMRNTLHGLVNQYKKVTANVGLSGVNYPHHEGHIA